MDLLLFKYFNLSINVYLILKFQNKNYMAEFNKVDAIDKSVDEKNDYNKISSEPSGFQSSDFDKSNNENNINKLNDSDLDNKGSSHEKSSELEIKKDTIQQKDNKKEEEQIKEEDEPRNSIIEILKGKINDTYYFLTSIPLFTRSVIFICLSFYVVCLLVHPIAELLSNIPKLVVSKIRIWTIFTGTFIPSGILNLTFCLIFWVHKAKNLEKSLSTVRYMINFFIDCFMTSFLYFLTAIVFRFYELWPQNGLLAVTMCQNTLLCIANPNVNLSFIFFDLNSKYYPLLLSLIMLIVHLFKAIDILIGIIYAFVYYYLIRIQLSDEFAAKMEEIMSFCHYFSSFVSVSDATGVSNKNEPDMKNKQEIVISTNNNYGSNNKNDINIEKLDKSSDRGKPKNNSSNQVNYINLEDDKTN